jgi:hypothetical protein
LLLFLIGTAAVFFGAYSYFSSTGAAAICVIVLLPLSAGAYVFLRRLALRRNAGP